MTNGQPYSYAVLRYVHDVMTGEFVNVGVVLHAPATGFFEIRVRNTIGRIKEIFPDLDRKGFKSAMRGIERAISASGKDLRKGSLFGATSDALKLALVSVPGDDSSIQWSGLGVGITVDPEVTLARLFDRLVTRYDQRLRGRRTEDEIWKPVRKQLEQKHLVSQLHEKVFHSESDEIVFEYASGNGLWHCYEPISLDMADADGIKEKARRWLGHLSAVADSTEPFKPYFLVGAPQNPALLSAFESAIAILRKSPIQVEVFEESQVDELVAQIERDVSLQDTDGKFVHTFGQSDSQ